MLKIIGGSEGEQVAQNQKRIRDELDDILEGKSISHKKTKKTKKLKEKTKEKSAEKSFNSILRKYR